MHNTNLEEYKPVFRFDNFVGRDMALKYVFDNINDTFATSLAFIGELGSGKSSLLNMISMKSLQKVYGILENKIIVFVENVEKSKSSADFYKYLFKSICRELKKRDDVDDHFDEVLKYYKEIIGYTDVSDVQDSLDDVLREIKDRGFDIILLFDDFDKIVKATNIDVEEFIFLRSIEEDTCYSISYIITSRKSLSFISEAAKSSGFCTIFKTDGIHWSPIFETNEIKKYLSNSFHDKCFSNEQINIIQSISGGVPDILRSTCKILMDNKTVDVNFNTIEYVSEKVAEERKLNFNRIINGLDIREKEYLLDTLDKNEILHYELESLVGKSILKENQGKYKYLSIAFEKYIERNKDYLIEKHITANLVDSKKYEIGIELMEINSKISILQNTVENIPLQTAEITLDKFLKVAEDLDGRRKKYLESYNGRELNYLEFDEYANFVKEDAKDELDKLQFNIDSIELPQYILEMKGSIDDKIYEFLVVGEFLFDIFKDSNMNLSHISICYCKIVEMEINTVILPTMKLLSPNVMINGIPLKSKTSLMIGDVTWTLKNQYPRMINRLFEDVEEGEDFINKLEIIRIIRNDTTHDGKVVTKDKVIKMRKYLFEDCKNLIKSFNYLKERFIIN